MSPQSDAPEAIVADYYRALAAGDMASLRTMMVPGSYVMTLEAYGLRRALTDPVFKVLLKQIETDASALEKVEKTISLMLRQDNGETARIADIWTETLGPDRCAVRYTEAGIPKKLSFSKTEAGWKIDYYAGRKLA